MTDFTLYMPIVASPARDERVDLTGYMIGPDSSNLRIGNSGGSYERFYTRHYGNSCFAQVKAWDGWERVNYQLYTYDSFHVYAWVDTSPAAGRFYTHFGAPWVRRFMRPGDRFSAAKRVQFYDEDTCRPVDEFSGDVTDTIEFVERHDLYTFRAGDWEPVTLVDVVQLRWLEGGEDYFYARGLGLVAWQRRHEDPNSPRWSAVSGLGERNPSGARLLDIPCLAYPLVPEGWSPND